MPRPVGHAGPNTKTTSKTTSNIEMRPEPPAVYRAKRFVVEHIDATIAMGQTHGEYSDQVVMQRVMYMLDCMSRRHVDPSCKDRAREAISNLITQLVA